MPEPATPLIYCIVGTRPELIKMAPVVHTLSHSDARVRCIHTGQHTDLARQAFADMDLTPDVSLTLPRSGLNVGQMIASLLSLLLDTLTQARPDVVVVHGDTASAWAAAQAAFYLRIPVAHVEAGLRCETLAEPFPEEAHRRLIGRLARWHYAPTTRARQQLVAEQTLGDIVVTGNTAIDSIRRLTQSWSLNPYVPDAAVRAAWSFQARTGGKPFRLFLTVHRRENWGIPLVALIEELVRWVVLSPNHQVIWALHANPSLQSCIRTAFNERLSLVGISHQTQVHLLPPLSYPDTVWALQHADALATDSGGLQEEASAFYRPTLILRNSTERPEAIESGYAMLVGCGQGRLVPALQAIQNGLWPAFIPESHPRRWPFGDGHAARRIARHLLGSLSKTDNPTGLP